MDANDINRRDIKPSLIENFTISGLYGYRTISFSSEYSATILIAANGSGKTTLIGALDAFLKGQLFRLQQLVFSEIRCKLSGVDKELVLSRDDINQYLDFPTDGEFARYALRIDVQPRILYEFLVDQYPFSYGQLRLNDIFQSIFKTEGYAYSATLDKLNKLRISLRGNNTRVDDVLDTISKNLKNIEVVYLPTYRRIEIPRGPLPRGILPREEDSPSWKVPSGSVYGGDIYFGLGDIEKRLEDLNKSILVDSNIGYRRISGDIVKDLIEGKIVTANETDFSNPDIDDLKLFFSRLREESGPRILADEYIPEASQIQHALGDSDKLNAKYLRYFLSKLHDVIKSTQEIEKSVEDFVNICNKYLSSQSLAMSGIINKSRKTPNQDDKTLKLDRKTLKVHLESIIGNKKIALDALSSGEKQMVSLFSKLFLYPEKEKIILIDEPELSLSIDWQRHILVDIITAPLCRQLVAITHSPFVFDNELEPYAKVLDISLNLSALPSVSDDEEMVLGN